MITRWEPSSRLARLIEQIDSGHVDPIVFGPDQAVPPGEAERDPDVSIGWVRVRHPE